MEENYNKIESKLDAISQSGVIANTYVTNFKYVKQKRWIADYNLSVFSKSECDKCIDHAEKFLDEVKRFAV